MQLLGSIIATMPIRMARKRGLSNASIGVGLMTDAIEECSEAYHVKLIGVSLQKLEREIREAAIALFNTLLTNAAGPLLASMNAVTPQLF